ncbi:MAG: prepilin peptidase [Chloroflexota bacterium]
MDIVCVTIAVAAAVLAAIVDVRSRRIPNWLTAGLVLTGIGLNVWRNGVDGLLTALTGLVLGLVVLLPFYAMRVMGAGDVKLLAGLGAVLGPHVLVSVAVYGALAGGIISAVLLLRAGSLLNVLNEVFVLHRPPTRGGQAAPYGVAIASGTVLMLVLPPVLG